MEKKKISSVQIETALDLDPLRKFIRNQVMPGTADREKQGGFPLALFRELHALGWLQAFVPAALGGTEARTIDLICAARELAYGSPGMATSFAGNMLAQTPILHFGTEKLRTRIARELVERFSLSSFCFTEPDTGSDIMRTKTTATRTKDGYRLTGQKCLITNANHAEHFTIIARLDGVDNPKQSLTAFYVPAGAAGLSTGKPYEKMGHSDSNTAPVFLDGVWVPEDHRLGKEGEGLRVAFHSLQRSRTLFAASAVGLCQRAGDLVKDDLTARMRFGKPLLAHPTVTNFLSQLHTEMMAAWFLTCAAGAEWDAGNFELRHSSMAKLYAGQTAMKFVSGALELIGGWGYLKEFEMERLFRDAKLYEIIEGPSFVQQAIIAKELFPLPREEKLAGTADKKAA